MCTGRGWRKTEAHLEWNLERGVKGKKMGFYSRQRKTRDPLLSGVGNLMVVEKMTVLKVLSPQS